jgi:SulP family sulfate permease
LALMHWAARRLVILNWSLLGLLAGAVLFWVCKLGGDWAPFLGHTLPVLSLLEQLPVFFKTHVFLFEAEMLWRCIWLSLPYAFVIAIINSLEALVANARFERMTEIAHNPQRLLVVLGQANVFSGLLGGLPVSLSNTKMTLAYTSGVRDTVGVWVHCVALLLMILTTAWYVHFIPSFAIAVVMLYLAWAMLDVWSLAQLRTWLRWSDLVARFCKPQSTPWIFMLVLIIASSSNLVWGVLLGLLCTVFVFVQRQSKSVVRQFGFLSQRRSVVMRNTVQTACLNAEDDRVIYVELQGALFFGTAESLLKFVRSHLTSRQQVIILDGRKLLEIDDAGCEAIERLQGDLMRRGGMLVLSAWDEKVLESSEDDLVVLKRAMQQPIFASYDSAAEYCEDWLLRQYGDEATFQDVCEFDAQGGHLYFLQQLSAEHRKILWPLLQVCNFSSEQIIFTRGQVCDGMYLVMSGRVDIWLNHGQTGAIRLASCRQGVSFGEMAFISSRPRSADAVAVGDVTAMRLSLSVLKLLEQKEPAVLADLMGVIARDLAGRLYQANANLRLALQ